MDYYSREWSQTAPAIKGRTMLENVAYRLAAIDVDGTLVGPDLTVSSANAEAIRRLREAGMTILLASGRSHANILPFYRQLAVEGLVVSAHGAVVRDSGTGEYLLEDSLSSCAVQVITEEGRRLGVSILHYRREGVFVEQETAFTRYEQSRNFESQIQIPDLLHDRVARVHKVVWLAERERIEELTTAALRNFASFVNVTHTDPEYLEFTAPTANKANGVAAVVKQMGIEPSDVIAFGDANNDIPLLAWAGLGIAMPHAAQGVKEASNFIGPLAPVEVALARAIDCVTVARL